MGKAGNEKATTTHRVLRSVQRRPQDLRHARVQLQEAEAGLARSVACSTTIVGLNTISLQQWKEKRTVGRKVK